MALSRAVLSGVVLTEPEKRFTPNNIAVTQFSIQVAPSNPNEKPFQVQVTCWRQLAEVAAESVRAGETVILEGRLQIHRTENAGNYHSNYELDVSSLYKGQPQLLFNTANTGKNTQDYSPNKPAQQQQPAMVTASVAAVPAQATAAAPNDDFFATEDDIPF